MPSPVRLASPPGRLGQPLVPLLLSAEGTPSEAALRLHQAGFVRDSVLRWGSESATAGLDQLTDCGIDVMGVVVPHQHHRSAKLLVWDDP